MLYCERHKVKYDKQCTGCFIEQQLKPLPPEQFKERIENCTIQQEINDNDKLRERSNGEDNQK